MENDFDAEGAGEKLEKFAIERATFRRAGVQLAELARPHNWTSLYHIYQSNKDSRTWHIVHAKDNIQLVDPQDLEELVISIQGIIWKQDLPPFTQQIQRPTQNHIRFLRQSVTLTGCSTATFDRGIETILDIQSFFERHIPGNKLDQCTFIEKCGNSLGIHLTNRYFTPKREAPTGAQIPLTSEIDPAGILATLAGDQFFYGEQNIVKYYNRRVVQGGAIKYEAIPPVRFQVGDIVEAKATLMLIPMREGRFKMTAILRSLTLLDTSFAQTLLSASKTRLKKLMQPLTSSLKRSIAYEDDHEEESVARKKTVKSTLPEGNTNLAQASSSKTATREEQESGKNMGADKIIAVENTVVVAHLSPGQSNAGKEKGKENENEAGSETGGEELMAIDE